MQTKSVEVICRNQNKTSKTGMADFPEEYSIDTLIAGESKGKES